MSIQICSPSAIAAKRRILTCPVCKTRRRFTCFDYGWWGFDWICHTCGVRVQDNQFRLPSKAEAQVNQQKARSGWAEPYDNSVAYWYEQTMEVLREEVER